MNREDIYSAFIECMNNAFVVFEIVPSNEKNYDFLIIDVNKKFEEYFNISKSTLINKNIRHLSDIFQIDISNYILKISNITIPTVFEVPLKNLKKYFEITAYPLDTKFIALQIVNITKRKLLETALAESEEKYKALADKSPISIIIIDKKGKITFANEYFFENFLENQFQKDQIIGNDLSAQEFCSTQYCNQIKKVLENHIIELKDIELKVNNKSLYCNVRGVPLIRKDEIKGGIIIIENITERKIAELKLQHKNIEQKLLLDNVDLLIWFMQSPDKITLYNHAFSEFFGIDNEINALNLYDFLPNFEAEEFSEIFHKVWKNKYPQYFDRFIFNKIGNKRLLRIKVTPKIDYSNNQVEFLICSAMDITEQRRNEEEMKNLIIALKLSNRLTDERATEIMELNRQLSASKERLKASLAAKDKFFNIIAHDLISPFQGFMSLTKYLSTNIHELSTKEIQELASALNKSAVNLHKLLENLLNWSRIQRGKIKYQPEYIDLKQIVEMNISLALVSAQAKKINLTSEIKEQIKVYSDLNILNTIVRNLISNAIKFTNYGGNVSVGYNKIDNDFIELYVKDDGIGMDEATQENLFKIDNYNSTLGTANETGTGLGLVLCKEFAEINKGSIRVKSSPGMGSTFFVKIPLKEL